MVASQTLFPIKSEAAARELKYTIYPRTRTLWRLRPADAAMAFDNEFNPRLWWPLSKPYFPS